MKYVISHVASVEENVGFRSIGHLVAETDEERDETLPFLVSNMKDVLKMFAKEVAPEVSKDTIVYRLLSLPELAYVMRLYKKNLGLKMTVELAEDVEFFPEGISHVFKFQLECFKQQNKV